MHRMNDDEVQLSLPFLAEAQFVVCGISALFSRASNCTNHPDLSHMRTEANAGRLLGEEPYLPRRIMRIVGTKIIRRLKAALLSKQA